jgi:hypothetical protein
MFNHTKHSTSGRRLRKPPSTILNKGAAAFDKMQG